MKDILRIKKVMPSYIDGMTVIWNLMKELEDLILIGEIKEGEYMWGTAKICDLFGVGERTAEKALQIFRERGMIDEYKRGHRSRVVYKTHEYLYLARVTQFKYGFLRALILEAKTLDIPLPAVYEMINELNTPENIEEWMYADPEPYEIPELRTAEMARYENPMHREFTKDMHDRRRKSSNRYY